MLAKVRDLFSRMFGGNLLPQAVFWSWNAVFIAVVYFGLLQYVLWDLVQSTIYGPVPWDFTLFSALTMLIPVLCTVFAAIFLRREPRKLIGLFYGIEAPLFLLCLCRLFLVREMTAGVAHLLLSFYVAAFFYLYELLKGYNRSPFAATVQMIGQTLLLLCGLYVAALLSFYVPPALYVFLKEFFSTGWIRELYHLIRYSHGAALFFGPLALILFGYSTILFVGSPIALVLIAVRSFRRVYAAFSEQFGRLRSSGIVVAVLAGMLLLFVAANRQPQSAAFALLKDVPHSDLERQQILAHEGTIRAGLLNAYLSPFRYLSSIDENDHVREMYRETFKLHGEAPAFLQRVYNQLARPFLFNGHEMLGDQRKAEELYEQFFDTPLQKGERESVMRALEATYSSDQREAGLLNQGQHKVLLARQEVTTHPHGDWAEIELHEVYENQSYEQQEIFYYFSLPASGAITGLWLGDTDDRKNRFPFVVAPRGAAQKIYKREVQRRADPALLEQIGPRQYRLRAFPIPARKWRSSESAAPLHLWLTYQVFGGSNGYPLPELGEQRNVYWSWRSKRMVDGKPQRFGSSWLPAFTGNSTTRTAHEVTLPDGSHVRAQPLSAEQTTAALPSGRAIAVVLDRSKSMERVTDEVSRALSWLQVELGQGRGNDLDYYLTASPYRGEGPSRVDDAKDLGPSATLYYGAQKLRGMLQQFDELKRDKHYDAILVLTDDGSFDLADDKGAARSLGAPVWLVHLGGKVAPGYDDSTLATIQKSGGGIATSVNEAVHSLALLAAANGNGNGNGARAVASYEDGWLWTVEQSGSQPGPAASDDGFMALAARQVILQKTRLAQLGSLEVLDGLHQIAVRHSIVSPYSSMLVLVNDEQRELLKRASAEQDRFDREVENGKERLSPPANPLHVSGTPEPHEWLLLMLAGAALLFVRPLRRSPA